MRAILFRRFGGPEVLEEGELPAPSPRPGEVRLRVLAVALNHLDVWCRSDPSEIPMPHVGGSDVVGVVGPMMTSQDSKALRKSSAIRRRSFWAFR